MPSDPDGYASAVRAAAVVVSSAGVAGSAPWKLAEFLAAGACIVTERPATTLPEPLVDGVHVRFFADPDEAVDRCRELLDDPDQRARLAVGARAYYEAHVRPAVAVHRWLGAVLHAGGQR